ncbi:MAG: hypothetical protein JO119_03495 [Acidobacteria bacterium]|nr:hypothetical protein [Acidobacteriota bacterium]
MNARSASGDLIEAEALGFEPSRVKAHAGIDAGRIVLAAIVVAVAIFYVVTLKPGHVFVNDDFAAYVMHAKNLVEGRSYSDIRYIPNPDAMWLSPTSGYPPIYPMILVPVYRIFGLDLHAFKIVTVLCFIGFLAVYAEMTREVVGSIGCAALLLLIAYNPVFWGQRDFILSEFPYLLFSFAALLEIERAYARLERHQVDTRSALLVSGLIYCAYGTRTIGIALVFALIAADLLKFRRPSRFLLCVIALVGVMIGAQTLLLTSPKGYVSAFHFSLHTVDTNIVYYGKTLSYVWANGFNKQVQIVFALLFTAVAAWGFAKSLWHERGVKECYLLGYVAVLLAWNSEIGLRGLLPILPLYLFYGMREWIRLFETARLPVRLIAVGAVVGLAAVSYAGEITHERSLPVEPNVADTSATKMFAFVREHTSQDDVLVFPKPRTLSLFTELRAAALSPEQSEEQALAFLLAIHATVVVDPEWSAVRASVEISALDGREVFHAGEYHVYRLNPASGN